MPPPRYPSDLSDAEWAILETVALVRRKAWPSTEVAAEVRGGRCVLPALRSGCSWRMLPREYPTAGRRSTTTFASGGSTAGCGEPTIGCERRCARRPDATATPARPSSTARLLRPPRWADRNTATTERSVSPDESATSWWTRTGWCWLRGFTVPTSPIETVGDDC
jgi:transposase